MCGIGFVAKKNQEISDDELHRQALSIRHRGPDGVKTLNLRRMGFSHARLAIQDLQDSGRQPIQRSGYILVFNGEIYNFLELKRSLKLKYGSVFEGSGDSEVLFEGLFHEGVDFVHRLNGDFAFVWYDPKKRNTYLVRDRLGVKPLYYKSDGLEFWASSEIRGLTSHREGLEIENEGLNSFLALRYVRQKSIFKGIQKVPPAHYLVLSEDLGMRQVKYWCPFQGSPSFQHSKLFSLIEDSVSLRLRSKVPVGVLMSGGMDSTIVGAIASERSNTEVSSFTCRFPNVKSSETDTQRAVRLSKKLHFDSHIYSHQDDSFSQPIDAIEEPIGDSIIGPLFGLVRSASPKVKVLLSGEGADELFAGYGHHYFLNTVNKAPPSLKFLLRRGLPFISHLLTNALDRVYPAQLGNEELRRLTECLSQDIDLSIMYHRLCEVFTLEQRKQLMGRGARSMVEETEAILSEVPKASFLKRLLYLELKTWLCNYNLLKLDKISGWFGMETRVPYLDHRIVELVFQMPDEFLMGLVERKPVIKDFCKTLGIPGPEKIPFTYKKRAASTETLLPIRPPLNLNLKNLEMFEGDFLASKRRDLLEIFSLWEETVFGNG